MVEIIPAIMPKDLTDLEQTLKRVVGLVPIVQLDVMDGKFVPPKSWPYTTHGEKEFKEIVKESAGLPFWQEVDFEIDLMVEKPEEVIEQWIQAGARRLVIHMESTKNLQNIIRDIAVKVRTGDQLEIGAIELGLALGTQTPIETVAPYTKDIDFVQLMGIERVGYQGEAFSEQTIDRVRALREAYPELIVSIDGGVSRDTAPLLIRAGAHRLVSGSAVFHSDDIQEAIKTLSSDI
jgi:ribulose-phosphate 3-epimerase